MKILNNNRRNREQIEGEWIQNKISFSEPEKIHFLKEILNDTIEFVDSENLFFEILVEISSSSDDFVNLLSLISTKLTGSIVYPNLLIPLIEIGRKNPPIAQKLLDKIYQNVEKPRLIAISGHILGGIFEKKPEKFINIFQDRILDSDEFLLLSYIKAFRIICNFEILISKEEMDFIEKVIERNVLLVNIELIYLSIDNYSKERNFFLNLLEFFLNKKEIGYKIAFFHPLNSFNQFAEEDIYALIDVAKNCDDGDVLYHLSQVMIKYPNRDQQNMNIIFQWIQNKLIWKIGNINHIFHELAKRNFEIIDFYILEYKKYCQDLGFEIEPVFFEIFISTNANYAMKSIKNLEIESDFDNNLQLKLFRKMISYCYIDNGHYPIVKEITVFLLEKYQNTPFLEYSISDKILQLDTVERNRYDSFVDSVINLIDNLQNHQDSYDFDFIFNEIEKYPTLKNYVLELLEECKTKKMFSPLLIFLQPIENKLIGNDDDLKDNNWGKAWLSELESGLVNYGLIPNSKYNSFELKKKYVSDHLRYTNECWSFLYELVIMNRLGSGNILERDINFGFDSDLDLFVKSGDSKLLFEVTSLRMPRDLKISNEAVALKALSFKTINKKILQLLKSGAGSFLDVRDDYFYYIAINVDQCPLGEEDIATAIFGPMSVITYHDKITNKIVDTQMTRNIEESVLIKNKNSRFVSGVIFFKTQYPADSGSPQIITLKGEIVNNPWGKNILNDSKLAYLKKCLFSNLSEIGVANSQSELSR